MKLLLLIFICVGNFIHLPRVAATSCLNDADFKISSPVDEGDAVSCRQIGNEETRRQALCTNPIVSSACQLACGKCCADDDTFVFNLKSKKATRSCTWLLKSEEKKSQRLDRYCNAPLANHETKYVRDGCVASCDFCKEEIQADMTKTKNIGSTPVPTPAPTPAPTAEPTKKPTLAPSHKPTATPTKCYNDPTFTFPLTFAGRMKGCDWLNQDKHDKVNKQRKAKYCDDEDVKLACCACYWYNLNNKRWVSEQ